MNGINETLVTNMNISTTIIQYNFKKFLDVTYNLNSLVLSIYVCLPSS